MSQTNINSRPTIAATGGVALRWQLLALALGGVAIGTGEFVPMGLLPEISRGLHVSLAAGGAVISAYALGVVIGAPILSVLTARLPRRGLLLALMGAVTVGSVLSALAPSLGWLIAARVVAGLPHGAFFGTASLTAASLVSRERRSWAVARALGGLTVANLALVPLTALLGAAIGWRSAYLIVGAIGLVSVAGLAWAIPPLPGRRHADPRRELRAMANVQVLLTLAVASVGLGGMFAVYTYITPVLTERAGLPPALVPIALAVWGLGMLAGAAIGGRIMDRWLTRSLFATLGAFAAFLVAFAVLSLNPVTVMIGVFLVASGFAVVPGLQTRLMEVAGEGQSLAAALNHAAFNIANALGAAAGGAAIARTGSLAAPVWVGLAMAAAGVAILAIAVVSGAVARRPEGETRLRATRRTITPPSPPRIRRPVGRVALRGGARRDVHAHDHARHDTGEHELVAP